MKAHLPYLVIIVGLVIFLAVRSCQQPPTDTTAERVEQLKDTIRIVRERATILQDRIDSLLTKRTSESKKSEARQKASNLQIAGLKKQAAEQRKAIDSLLDRNPAFLDLIATQDTIISRQGTEIVHLQQDLKVSDQTSQELTQAYQHQQRLNGRITAEFKQIVSVHEKNISTLEKKVRRHKAIGWIALGVGFIGGVLIAK
jgi:hypothetical protein